MSSTPSDGVSGSDSLRRADWTTAETVDVTLTWQEIADLRHALQTVAGAGASARQWERYAVLEARLSEAHQRLPNPLDTHLPKP